MKLYNTLSKKVEEIIPLKDNVIGIYSCGPTVYDNLHIGNLSSFIYADLLRRVLKVSGNDVIHVMNLTDIDDKTIKKSQIEYPEDEPIVALKKTTDHYSSVFMNDLINTGNDTSAIHFISAVESIPDMISLIQQIIDKGIAYKAEDGIYFSIHDYESAGHTYGLLQKIEVSNSKSRISNDEYDKESANDFALWKKSIDGEPSWNAEFNVDGTKFTMPGRPGWHIECSAMSQKILGVPFDIHTGGIDLKFPHHENEIAQTVSAGAPKLANYFFHNAHILIDGRKMSKSLGNIYTLRDLETKGFDPNTFRMLVLESHYSSESNFTWEIMLAAQNRLKNWQATADLIWQTPSLSDVNSHMEIAKNDILVALRDDLNTPSALEVVDKTIDYIKNQPKDEIGSNHIESFFKYIEEILGLKLIGKDIDDSLKALISKRNIARKDKNWKVSDSLRDELLKKDVGLNDETDNTIWYRV